MTRAHRLLSLAFQTQQRGETAIAGRIVSLAFAEPEAAAMIESLNGKPTAGTPEQKAEAILRKAEASTQGSIFTTEGTSSLLAIAEKAHKDGLPKIAQLIADVASY